MHAFDPITLLRFLQRSSQLRQNMMYDSECLRGKPNTSNRNRKKSKLTSGAGGDHFHCQRWIGQRRRHYCTVWSCTQAFAEIHRHWCSHQICRFSHTANFQWAPAKFYFHTKFGPKSHLVFGTLLHILEGKMFRAIHWELSTNLAWNQNAAEKNNA